MADTNQTNSNNATMAIKIMGMDVTRCAKLKMTISAAIVLTKEATVQRLSTVETEKLTTIKEKTVMMEIQETMMAAAVIADKKTDGSVLSWQMEERGV